MIRLLSSVGLEGATRADAAILADIHADAFRRTWGAHDFTSLLANPSVFALLARTRPLLGPSRVAGFVLVRFAADEAEILTIAVRSRDRRRGHGRLLMEDVVRRLYRERIAKLFLEVEGTNIAAISLYRSLGFEIAGERPNYYSAPAAGAGTALVMRLQVL
jgi:ribosomal-protein-alanine N-acetyltransferase